MALPEARGARGSIPRAQAGTASFALVVFFWIIYLYEPHTFLSSKFGAAAVLMRIPTVMLLPLLAVVWSNARKRDIPWPLVSFCSLLFLSSLFAENRGLARIGAEQLARLSLVFLATVATVTPTRALVLLKLLLLSFLWYGLQAIPSGTVGWHGTLGNEDGLSPVMVVGMGFAYYFGLGAKAKKWRYLGFGISGLCAVACVASFARGSMVAAALVLLLIWIRSPRKLATLFAGIIASVLLLVAIEQIHTGGSFWKEMGTIAEGTSAGTGLDRKRLWLVGFHVWKQAPIFGVGAYNAGVVASVTSTGGFEGGYENPGHLWGRSLHNGYIQLLAETGIVGISLWLWMLWTFVRQLRQMRAPRARASWNKRTGGSFDLRCVSIGLELGMVSFLVTAFFYNQLFEYMFYTLFAFSTVLYESTRPGHRARAPTSTAGR